MKAASKINSRRMLAIELSKSSVDFETVSKSLHATVQRWVQMGEVKLINGKIMLHA